jgi:hypothetical protein
MDDDPKPSEDVIASYVRHGGGRFFVSTIERNSSAAAAPDHRYYETLVWTWDSATRLRGDLIHSSSGPLGSLREHFRICEAYRDTGRAPVES